MNLNSDAIQNVKSQMINLETGVVKASTDGPGILSPDISFSGIVGYMKAGETLALLDFVCYDNTANALKKCDADAAATYPCMGIVLEAGSSGEYLKILLYGYLKAADLVFGVQATQTLTVALDLTDNDTITIGSNVYEITVDGTVTGTNIAVEDVPGTPTAGVLTKADVPGYIAREINAHDDKVTAVADGFTVIVTATKVDIAATANAIATTETCAQASWGAATMASGTNGNKIYCGLIAGEHMVAASATSGDYNQVIGQALSMRELLFKPDGYGLVVP